MEIENVTFLTTVETVFENERKHYVTIFMHAVAKACSDGSAPEPKVRRTLLRCSIHSTCTFCPYVFVRIRFN